MNIINQKISDEVREDLIEMVYHDLRSPLSNVISSLEALKSMLSGDQAVNSLLNIALHSTEHIQRLTSSLIDINHLEAGQKLQVQTCVHADQLLEYSVEAVQFVAREKEICIQSDFSTESIELWVDVDMICRVLINLLENAVNFSPSKGKIWVGAKQINDAKIVFWVRDLGPGISLANQKQIFEKFVRLNPKNGSRGLGLGLAYCRLAVQAHGGEIWVESQPGQGSCFKFTLPLVSIEKSNCETSPDSVN